MPLLRILGIGLDKTLADSHNPKRTGTLERQYAYLPHVDRLTYVVYTPSSNRYQENTYAQGKLKIYPTHSKRRFLFFTDACLKVKKILKTESYNLLTAQDPLLTGPVGVWLKRKYHLPLNVQCHSTFLDPWFWRASPLWFRGAYPLMLWVFHQADTIRVTTRAMEESLQRLGFGKKIFRVPVVVPLTRFLEEGERSKESNLQKQKANHWNFLFNHVGPKNLLRLPDGQDFSNALGLLQSASYQKVLFVGRLALEKDLPTLLKAFSLTRQKFPPLLLILAGEGKEEEKLRKEIFKLDLQKAVFFLKVFDYSYLPHLYRACHLFVLPSLYEGNSLVLQEAAASGLPVVSTAVAGAKDLLLPEFSKYLVPQKEVSTLAEKMEYLLTHPQEASTYAQALQKKVQVLYHFDRMVNDLIQGYEKTLGKL